MLAARSCEVVEAPTARSGVQGRPSLKAHWSFGQFLDLPARFGGKEWRPKGALQKALRPGMRY